MKRIILFSIILFFINGRSQENFEVMSIRTLVYPQQETASVFMNPKWSPDGLKIAFTSANFRGLWVYEIQTGKLTEITDDISAGFGYSWSATSQQILSRVSKYIDRRRLSAIKIFNLDIRENLYLTDYRPRLRDIPQWTPGNDQVYFYNGNEIEFLTSNLDRIETESPVICYHIADKIFLEDLSTGEKTEFQPIPGSVYLNMNLSPDSRHVAFEVYGGNCMTLNLETGKINDLRTGNYPRWSPDGRYLVYMITQDDGHRYTASDIVVSDAEGTFFQTLTGQTDQIAMYPCWSPTEDKIVYSTFELGTIELLEFIR